MAFWSWIALLGRDITVVHYFQKPQKSNVERVELQWYSTSLQSEVMSIRKCQHSDELKLPHMRSIRLQYLQLPARNNVMCKFTKEKTSFYMGDEKNIPLVLTPLNSYEVQWGKDCQSTLSRKPMQKKAFWSHW